jgi:hypothetical protein
LRAIRVDHAQLRRADPFIDPRRISRSSSVRNASCVVVMSDGT